MERPRPFQRNSIVNAHSQSAKSERQSALFFKTEDGQRKRFGPPAKHKNGWAGETGSSAVRGPADPRRAAGRKPVRRRGVIIENQTLPMAWRSSLITEHRGE
jgi:hypothetical protein